jgi:hypothetical protein
MNNLEIKNKIPEFITLDARGTEIKVEGNTLYENSEMVKAYVDRWLNDNSRFNNKYKIFINENPQNVHKTLDDLKGNQNFLLLKEKQKELKNETKKLNISEILNIMYEEGKHTCFLNFIINKLKIKLCCFTKENYSYLFKLYLYGNEKFYLLIEKPHKNSFLNTIIAVTSFEKCFQHSFPEHEFVICKTQSMCFKTKQTIRNRIKTLLETFPCLLGNLVEMC